MKQSGREAPAVRFAQVALMLLRQTLDGPAPLGGQLRSVDPAGPQLPATGIVRRCPRRRGLRAQ
jgi:hypothetical protein